MRPVHYFQQQTNTESIKKPNHYWIESNFKIIVLINLIASGDVGRNITFFCNRVKNERAAAGLNDIYKCDENCKIICSRN